MEVLSGLKVISDDLTQRLGLRFAPVVINLIKKQDDLPPGKPFSEGK